MSEKKDLPIVVARSASKMLQQKPLAGVIALIVLFGIDTLQANGFVPELGALTIEGFGTIPLELAIATVIGGLAMWLMPPAVGETVATDSEGTEYRMQPVIKPEEIG